jgi:hypothetical protein
MNVLAHHPVLYQFAHPWHWLTYGQNSQAVGILGLVFYSWCTYRLLRLGRVTEYSKVRPYFVIQVSENPLTEFIIQNAGGPAVNVRHWQQFVSDGFHLNNTFIECSIGAAVDFAGSILSSEKRAIGLESEVPGKRRLYVFDCHDTGQGRHQLVVIRSWTVDGITTEAQMTNDPRFLPVWQRAFLKLREYYWRAKQVL